MKPIHWLIVIPVLAGAAFFVSRQMHRAEDHPAKPGREEMLMSATPEGGLLWLKTEFHLSDAEYERISAMHESYLPGCMERCKEIARVRTEFFALIKNSKSVTPDLKAKLDESARLRARCSELMLAHFYEVAAAMPPEAATRYLEWVTRETLMD
mgnify:FL=1